MLVVQLLKIEFLLGEPTGKTKLVYFWRPFPPFLTRQFSKTPTSKRTSTRIRRTNPSSDTLGVKKKSTVVSPDPANSHPKLFGNKVDRPTLHLVSGPVSTPGFLMTKP